MSGRSMLAITVVSCLVSLPARAQTPPGRVEARELTGTLAVDIVMPTDRDSWAADAGWFFLDGQLVGRLPLRKEVLLTPGEYEARAVYIGNRWNDQEIGFLAVSGHVRVERGQRTGCTITALQVENGAARSREWARCATGRGNYPPNLAGVVWNASAIQESVR